jgi:GNAT superfamily N-acetyltransferase
VNVAPAVTVRAAAAADAATIGRHRAAMFRDMGQVAGEDAIAALADATAGYLAEAIPAGGYAGWLALAPDDTVVGGAGAQVRPIIPRPGAGGRLLTAPQALLVNVYTEPAWRRQGVAERLIRAALAWADARGVSSVVLHASDAGRALYERLGFRPTNEMAYRGAPVAPLTRIRST